ncbi:MAG TPA: PRC-barrel domain-containing protein [Candidatus Limnocylindrales bacterium]|nr:PRC-barrel domain-containing protein [Candidatus Limnocylindrales bacterium]
MRVQLGATVRTQDGERAGTVSKVIWDPGQNQVTEFLVKTGGLLGHDVLISREVLEAGTVEGDDLVVALTKQELNGLQHYDEKSYAPPPYSYLSAAESTYAGGEFLVPLAKLDRKPPTNAATDHRATVIKKGMAVRDARGTELGTIVEVRIDDMTGELRAVVVGDSDADPATLREIAADQLDVGTDSVQVIDESGVSRESSGPGRTV